MKKKIFLLFLIITSVSIATLIGANSYLNSIKISLSKEKFSIDKISNLKIKVKTDSEFLRNIRISPFHDHSYQNNTLYIKDVRPTEKKIFIRWYFGIWKLKKTILTVINIKPLIDDKNLNGFPDVVELSGTDEENFRNWFINIANSLYYNDTPFWKKSQRDCAGFVRFCFKEALKKHNKYWMKDMNYKGKVFEDVKKYNYPDVPYLGVDIFRIKGGIDLAKKNFSFYASGRFLKEYNLKFVTKYLNRAKPGDILVYFHPQDYDFPFHMMIYLGNMEISNDYGWVIYHTGPINSLGGELRKVKISDLMKADPSWLPLPSNKNFLGFFKFKILK
jgi:hypothetical protein